MKKRRLVTINEDGEEQQSVPEVTKVKRAVTLSPDTPNVRLPEGRLAPLHEYEARQLDDFAVPLLHRIVAASVPLPSHPAIVSKNEQRRLRSAALDMVLSIQAAGVTDLPGLDELRSRAPVQSVALNESQEQAAKRRAVQRDADRARRRAELAAKKVEDDKKAVQRDAARAERKAEIEKEREAKEAQARADRIAFLESRR